MRGDTMSDTAKFLAASSFAVAGASRDASKYGHRVLVALRDSGRKVQAINPSAASVAGQAAFDSLNELAEVPKSVSVVTPPEVTEKVIDEAIKLGVENIWMQPGAEHDAASERARDAGLNVIDDGSCILVLLAME
ncbi:MAG: CoA-binding protein [Aureliella sp.]